MTDRRSPALAARDGKPRRLLVLLGVALLAGSAGAAPQRVAARRAPRPAVAFSPDGKTLAAGGYREVALLDAATGQVRVTLQGGEGSVTAVQFSPDGKTLAAAGGAPGRSGEIRLWNLETRAARLLSGTHHDVVYSLSWSADGKALAAGSYDHLVSLWDTATGQARSLKDHTDAVYGVAFSPDGRRLASVSADRTVKVWDPVSGKRLFTLSDATAELYSVAFHPSGRELAAGGVDRMLRKWTLTASSGTPAGTAFAHAGPVVRVLYTPDGSGLVTASEDRTVKLWDAGTLAERKVLEKQADWALGIALSPDGRRLGVSRYDGSVALYDTATGELQVRAGL